MSIVTLTSDWNLDDYYTAAVKGRIISRCPGTMVVDITNQIPPFNIALAAFQIKHSFRHFPSGTVHIVAVNSQTKEERPFVALQYEGHYFIGYDNGLFGLLLDKEPDEVVSIDADRAGSFPELTVFTDVACTLLQAGKLADAGDKYQQLYRQVPMLPTIEESLINGSVIYIDSFKNAFTNITHELFEQIGKGRAFEIFVQSNHYKINRLNKRYSDSSLGEILAIFNSLGLLEIAINGGNAADLLNLNMNSSIRIKFK
jgi:S-adenosyl-L-methionine hydrolase (adenosine-forming)